MALLSLCVLHIAFNADDFFFWDTDPILELSCGRFASTDSEGRPIYVAVAERDGKRFVVRADEKLTAFMELESAIAHSS